jgi:transcription initiation factor TFIIIB Brf1 subunit/transcription initiation factor TFIIB
MPQYDKWYKDTLEGKMKSFYPKRIPLLEKYGAPLLLFHVHHHAILGEAKIVESKEENKKHFYRFEEFVPYSNPVQLELTRTDQRLPRLARRGRWMWVNVQGRTVSEIRKLSILTENERRRLGKNMAATIDKLNSYPPTRKESWECFIEDHCRKLKTEYNIDASILNEAKRYFKKGLQTKCGAGRSRSLLFYASLYLAFRTSRTPKPMSYICEISRFDPSKLFRVSKSLAVRLEMSAPPLSPEQALVLHQHDLKIPKKTVQIALKLIKMAREEKRTVGRNPNSIAASALVVAALDEGRKMNRVQTSKIFGISEVTLRNNVRALKLRSRTLKETEAANPTVFED